MSFFGPWAFQDHPPSICVSCSIAFFSGCLSQVFLYYSQVFRYFGKSCDRNIWLRFHPEPQKGATLSAFGQAEEGKMSRQKSLIRTKLILDCLTILQNICEVVTVKTVELEISRFPKDIACSCHPYYIGENLSFHWC